ncbi:MAG TPA: hypothetical protein ENH84_02005 [Phycisphaerae bacterium]|nr:hypothetical protein [Phycisphaerae bacterium]
MKHVFLMTVVGLGVVLVGCGQFPLNEGLAPGRGTIRGLGDTSYQEAFATGRMVMSQFFSIASADVNTGIIKSRPKKVDAGKERLLGSSPARQIATMQISQKNGQVVAQVLVMQQRQGSAIRRQMGYSTEQENYTGNPGEESPANIDAAITPEQKESWADEKARHGIEADILNDLYKRLHGR